jgi:hypothetical protein
MRSTQAVLEKMVAEGVVPASYAPGDDRPGDTGRAS